LETLDKIKQFTESNYIDNVSDLKKQMGVIRQGDDYTLAPMLSKEMAQIDWSKTANEIHNLVRGLDPIMGAYTFYKGKKLKVWKTYTRIESEKFSNTPGEILDVTDAGILVQAGEKKILLQEIQAENSRRMTVKEYLNGNEIEKHVVLG